MIARVLPLNHVRTKQQSKNRTKYSPSARLALEIFDYISNKLAAGFALLDEFIFFAAKENGTKRNAPLIHRRLRRYPALLEK